MWYHTSIMEFRSNESLVQVIPWRLTIFSWYASISIILLASSKNSSVSLVDEIFGDLIATGYLTMKHQSKSKMNHTNRPKFYIDSRQSALSQKTRYLKTRSFYNAWWMSTMYFLNQRYVSILCLFSFLFDCNNGFHTLVLIRVVGHN